MDVSSRSPLLDLFRRGEVGRDLRLLAAKGALAPRALEQLALLILLTDDTDAAVAAQAMATLDSLPAEALRAFLARSEAAELRSFFAARGVQPAAVAAASGAEPLLDTSGDLPDVPKTEGSDPEAASRVLSTLPIMDRVKLAMKGTREQRSQLIRDPNKMVAAAVLTSPKLTDAEVESFAKMANVSEEVLRVIGSNRNWLKNYGVMLALSRNPKTPLALSMQYLHRLNERDTKMLSIDRNVPEALRLAARKVIVKSLK
jgi:hypothetical protein